MENTPEKFEIALRLQGNEIIAFSVESQSSRKNWVVIGSLILLLVAYAANLMLPVIHAIIG